MLQLIPPKQVQHFMALWLVLGDAGTAGSPKQLDKSWHSLKGSPLTTEDTKQDSSSFMQDFCAVYCELIQEED